MAWILLWEWSGPHAAVEDRIAAILRPRLSRQIVGEVVECLYAVHAYSPTEMAVWSRRRDQNPYKAQWHDRHCFCGGNPSLHAIYIQDLIITEDPSSGVETLRWKNPPLFRFNNSTGEIERERGVLPQAVTRARTGPLSDREVGRASKKADQVVRRSCDFILASRHSSLPLHFDRT